MPVYENDLQEILPLIQGPVRDILDQELALGNVVDELSAGWPVKATVWLGRPFTRDWSLTYPGLRYTFMGDPKNWIEDYFDPDREIMIAVPASAFDKPPARLLHDDTLQPRGPDTLHDAELKKYIFTRDIRLRPRLVSTVLAFAIVTPVFLIASLFPWFKASPLNLVVTWLLYLTTDIGWFLVERRKRIVVSDSGILWSGFVLFGTGKVALAWADVKEIELIKKQSFGRPNGRLIFLLNNWLTQELVIRDKKGNRLYAAADQIHSDISIEAAIAACRGKAHRA